LAKNLSLKDLRDSITPRHADETRLLKRHGIPVIMYMSAMAMRTDSLDGDFVERLAARTVAGKTIHTFSRRNEVAACINHPEWIEFASDYGAVLCTTGQADGVFVDNVWVLQPCYCSLCQKKFQEEVAQRLNMPELTLKDVLEMESRKGAEMMTPDDAVHYGRAEHGAEHGADGFQIYGEYCRWRTNSYISYLRKLRKEIERKVGQKIIFILNGHAVYGWSLALQAEEDLLDAPYFEEGFSYPPMNNIYASKAGQAACREKHPTIIVSRVGPFGVPTPSQHKVFLAESMAFGGAASPWGMFLHGNASLEDANRQFNNFFRLYEDMYAQERDLSEVALLCSWQSHLFYEMNTAKPTARALSELLLSLRMPFRVLMLEKGVTAESLAPYKLVLLPELGCVADETVAAVRKYAQSGGMVANIGAFAEYDLALKRRQPVEFLDKLTRFEIEDIRNRCSKAPRRGHASESEQLTGMTADMPESASIVYMYDQPQGRLADFLRNAVRQRPLVKTTLPTGVFLNLTEGSDFSNVHLVNYRLYRFGTVLRIGVEPLQNVSVCIRVNRPVKNARLLSPDMNPMEQTIPFVQDGEYATVVVSLLEHYSIVRLEH
jgi:hypothetical protein